MSQVYFCPKLGSRTDESLSCFEVVKWCESMGEGETRLMAISALRHGLYELQPMALSRFSGVGRLEKKC